MAEYFPILKYKDGKLTRVNGTGLLIGGSYALLPLFSIYQEKFCDVSIETSIRINGDKHICKPHTICINGISDLPDPCFLVATRYGYPYTPEEVESLNKTWDKLMSELKNEG
jgi:hypothetical protein